MRSHALDIFHAAVKAVQPSHLLPAHMRVHHDILYLHEQAFPLQQWKNIYVVGAGKAAAAMAVEVENILGPLIRDGVVVTKYGHALPLKKIRCMEAGHPLPDEAGVKGGSFVLNMVRERKENDLIIGLISGGASALLADYPPGSSLGDVQQVFRLLLQSGADIGEMNAVRKHLSNMKGGQLSRAACPATIVSFILSDVIGDPLHVIASGPTVPDPTHFEDAWKVLDKYRLTHQLPASLYQWLQDGREGRIPETPKEGDPVFTRTFNHLIGTNRVALEAAATKAASLGYTPIIVSERLCGEARTEAFVLVDSLSKYNHIHKPCLLWGGETTVEIKGSGKGGRNQEFALAALIRLREKMESENIPVLLAAGTDGSDGPTEATGAVIDDALIRKVQQSGPDPLPFLENNDSYYFFRQAGGHVITGPLQTNVMDIVIALLP